MDHRAQLGGFGNAERQDVLRMGMHHRHHVGPHFVDAGMDEALEIERALLLAHRLAGEIELDDIGGLETRTMSAAAGSDDCSP